MQCIASASRALRAAGPVSRSSRPSRQLRVVAPRAALYPGPKEEKDVSHEAFVHAFGAARPAARIPGLQEFAAGLWERRRRIPSTVYNDPLDHIFAEFDADGDGHLTASEVARALQSRNVKATEEAVQMFIDAVDENNNGTIERSEWPQFVFHMASADLRASRQSMQDGEQH